nr:hypothetical protein CFP56_15121 [Quercus suber]
MEICSFHASFDFRNTILREANSTDPASSPSPNLGKPRSSRKSKSAKENDFPFYLTFISFESKPSLAMAAKLKSRLIDLVADLVILWVLGCCLVLKFSLCFYYTQQIK